MPSYTITWTNTDASTTTEHLIADAPRDAAHAALARQPDPDTIDTVFTVVDDDTGTTRTFTIDHIEKIAWRLWESPDWEPPITAAEARAIVEAWATPDLFPQFYAWINNKPVTTEDLLADCDALHENFAMNETHWPYEVAFDPAIRLASALTRHFARQPEHHRPPTTKARESQLPGPRNPSTANLRPLSTTPT